MAKAKRRLTKSRPKNRCGCGGRLYFTVFTTRNRKMKPDGTEGEWEDGGEEDVSIACDSCDDIIEL
jgi:hypothetical protein